MTELAYTSAVDLAAMVHSRTISATELMTYTLARIDRVNPGLNAIVSLDPERALRDASAIDDQFARGDHPGPLAGLPIVVKDLENAAGFPTSRGTSAFLGEGLKKVDSIHVERLRRAGALVIGKANTPPMGAAVHTDNGAFGITRNPWNTRNSPGGSSGGSAAAVAAGLAALATAGDGGGSTRIPGGLCGIVGLKPTRGRIPTGPHPTPDWPRHSVSTPMARTVTDTALQLDLTAGFHPSDPYSLPRPDRSYSDAIDISPPTLRIRVNRSWGVATPTPEVLGGLDTVVDVLTALGHTIIDDERGLPFSDSFPEHMQLRQRILGYHRFTKVKDEFNSRPENFEAWFAEILERGREVTLDQLQSYWRYRGTLDLWASTLFADCDLYLTPTTPTTAWPATGPDIARAVRDRTIPTAFTAIFNDTGNPAIALPAGHDTEGLPISAQFVGPHLREDMLLQVAAQYERAANHLFIHPDLTIAPIAKLNEAE